MRPLKNLLVLATHASYFVPEELQENLLLDERLLKNFSDYATANLLEKVPKESKVLCWFSRSIGDPNRNKQAHDLFREQDFNNNQVWKEALTQEQKQELIRTHYDAYHKKIQEKIRNNKPKIIIDVHDTGELLLGIKPEHDKRRENGFPELCISNYHNTTCNKETTNIIQKILEEELGLKATINDPYQGGFVTRRYAENNEQLTIQLEFNRSLYLDEKTQLIKEEEMKTLQEQFLRALQRIDVLF